MHRELGMMAALHEDLRAAEVDGFLNFLIDLIESDDVGVVVFFGAIKGAEFAIDVADVGVVDVAIDDVGGDFVAATVEVGGFGELAAAIGEGAEFFEGKMVKAEGFVAGYARAIPNPLLKFFQRSVVNHVDILVDAGGGIKDVASGWFCDVA